MTTASALSLDQPPNDEGDDDYYDLDERILRIVKQCPDHEIRPARLAAELGISVEDASAELCGLLRAVGKGSTFYFDGDVMVFTFPNDFEAKAKRWRRRQTALTAVRGLLLVAIKIIKIVTAFGLILSLLIVSIAAMIGLIAAIIAMSRGGHHGHRDELVRRLHSMFYTARQLLWCYAIFGQNFQGQDPFLQEIAYDLALMSSLCCGNPMSLLFWLRASQLGNRSRRRRRGWSSRFGQASTENLEGVALVQRGTWGREEEGEDSEPQQEPYRGLLSVSVEFLFGPTPFGPSEAEKWKMRGSVMIQLCSRDGTKQGVSLEELSPYVDFPPASWQQQHQSQLVSEGLKIVSHFNGRPLAKDSAEPVRKARFVFPELMSESSTVTPFEEMPDSDDGTWEYILYSSSDHAASVGSNSRSYELPSSLQERRYVLTRLEKRQFLHCVILGALNCIGVVWLRMSLGPEGVLDANRMVGGVLASFLLGGLMPVLHFYSILFFALPLSRLVMVVVRNAIRERRNRRRADFAHALQTQQRNATSD